MWSTHTPPRIGARWTTSLRARLAGGISSSESVIEVVKDSTRQLREGRINECVSNCPRCGRPTIEPWQGALDKLTKWIPGDTLAIYAPGATLLSVNSEKPSALFLMVMIIVTRFSFWAWRFRPVEVSVGDPCGRRSFGGRLHNLELVSSL